VGVKRSVRHETGARHPLQDRMPLACRQGRMPPISIYTGTAAGCSVRTTFGFRSVLMMTAAKPKWPTLTDTIPIDVTEYHAQPSP
jgi:hypothetical protein